jgi:hypothetical protein
MGYSLSDFGLTPIKGSKNKKSIECLTEEDIFKALDEPY